jgi:proteic killer suppression protein
MQIESIRHKRLSKLVENGDRRVMQAERLTDMVAFIVAAGSFDELSEPPNFGLHALTGNRAGEYAMAVTRNWRLTFTKVDDVTIADLDLEDYH